MARAGGELNKGMKTTKTTKKKDENENDEEEEMVSRINFELC